WVKDKYKPWILAGLSSAFTKMNVDIWKKTPFNTNVSESAHANINQDGRSLSLLAAIHRGDDFDQRQWDSAKTYEKYNIHETYRNKSELSRLTNNSKRT
ncbi:18838_t:CDS:2, partial [Gigaspora rosea]